MNRGVLPAENTKCMHSSHNAVLSCCTKIRFPQLNLLRKWCLLSWCIHHICINKWACSTNSPLFVQLQHSITVPRVSCIGATSFLLMILWLGNPRASIINWKNILSSCNCKLILWWYLTFLNQTKRMILWLLKRKRIMNYDFNSMSFSSVETMEII